MLFPYFAYIEHFTKLTRGSFLFKETFLLMEKIQIGRKSSVKKKKKKKKKAQRRKKEYQSVKKRKSTSFVKATRTGGAPRWRPDFEQRSRHQTKIYHT